MNAARDAKSMAAFRSVLLLSPPPSALRFSFRENEATTRSGGLIRGFSSMPMRTTLIKDELAKGLSVGKLKTLTKTRLSSSGNQTATAPEEEAKALVVLESASDVVRRFYNGINARDLASVQVLIADNCVYEDLIFPQPFVGRKAILEFFEKFINSISRDLQFVIDDVAEDFLAVGVTWHLEWQGRPFPFSKGCSFYRLVEVNGKKQIVYGRDSVEPSFKPGDAALVAIRGVTWLLQQFPQLADRL